MWGYQDKKDSAERQFRDAGIDLSQPLVQQFLSLYGQIQDLPRHLGQHSGGMVLCQGPLDSIVPLQPATMPGRVIVQWDKEDCADMGIIKVDLLGLGMMAVLEESIQLIRHHYDEEVDLGHLPKNDHAVYETLQQADTVGLFQVESRAQMSCLPRLKPKEFYDIVVEVAIIRPGPIVGNMYHPYLRRRQGLEPADPLHPLLEPVLKRTLGVPLFQEQLLRIAMIAASFALLAYASAYLKCHYLAAFTAAMLNQQPMGFYSAATLVKDAQRHGLHFKPVDITCSQWECTVEKHDEEKWLRLGFNYVKG